MTLQLANKTLLQQLEQISYQVQRSPEQIILEALHLYMKQKEITPLPSFWLAIIGLGSSDEVDVARRDEVCHVGARPRQMVVVLRGPSRDYLSCGSTAFALWLVWASSLPSTRGRHRVRTGVCSVTDRRYSGIESTGIRYERRLLRKQ